MTVTTTTTTTTSTTGGTSRALTLADGHRRFQTRADAFYVRHDGGVWLRNDVGSFSIRGASAYELVGALFENLDGERTLDDACAELPDGARGSVLRLVETLWRNGFIREVLHPAESPPEWMGRLYASHLMYLDHHGDRPVTRMTRVRSQRVVVAGDGLALRSLVGALGEFGIARVTVLTTTAGAAMLADVTERFHAIDPALRWRTVLIGDHGDLSPVAGHPELVGVGHVLIAVDGDRADELADLEHRLVAGGAEVGIVARAGDYVVAAPALAGVAALDRCWGCVRHSIVGSVAGEPSGLPPAVVPATMASLCLAQQLFRRLAGIDRVADPRITSVEPVAPVVRTHVVRQHPACRRHQTRRTDAGPSTDPLDDVVRPDVPASQDPAPLVAASDRIVAVTTDWTDPVVGPLLRLGEAQDDQLPLAVSSCQVADPSPPADAPVLREIRCRAVSPREARNQVVLIAAQWAASRVARLRGGLPAGHVLAAGWSPAEAHYRAWMMASAALPLDGPAWRRPDAGHQGPLRRFLTASLVAVGQAWEATATQDLPTGAVRATVRTASGRRADSVGLDPVHATDGALLRVLADEVPGAAALALLSPPVNTWGSALTRLTVNHGSAVDIGWMLPHLEAKAFLVAVPVPGVGP